MRVIITIVIILSAHVSYAQYPTLPIEHKSLATLPPCNISLRQRAVLVGKDSAPYYCSSKNKWEPSPVDQPNVKDSFFCHEFRKIQGFRLNYYLGSIKGDAGHLRFASSGDHKGIDREIGWFFPANDPFDLRMQDHFCVLDTGRSFSLVYKKGSTIPSEYKHYALPIDSSNCDDKKKGTTK